MPEWLSPQIVKEAHGKFTPWAKPQAFSIVSADLSFLDPFKNVIITFCFVLFFSCLSLRCAFLAVVQMFS